MTAMRTTLAELGIAAERVHTELFGALGRINPGITGATGAAGATPRILGFMSRL
ncbi:MAG TPA: hypothetical protein VG164_03000 [Trebonia sp.]|jgi:ferredoxin-NADP reductase|nr:hypothetical protein [Trebonia sp.]